MVLKRHYSSYGGKIRRFAGIPVPTVCPGMFLMRSLRMRWIFIFRSPSVSPDLRVRYDRIVQTANEQRNNPFYAVYRQLFSHPDQLKPYWDNARRILYEHSLKLWEQQNHKQLTEGHRIPPDGVTCRVKEPVKRPKKKIPGTIYLNNNRYYWIVARKMKAVPLIDPATAPKFPGTIFKNGSRYYWFIARHLKRQRLVPKGEKFSTDDKATAEKIRPGKMETDPKGQACFCRQGIEAYPKSRIGDNG